MQFLHITKTMVMDKKTEELQPQEAPLKNTDNAFVQVSEDGSPAMPRQTNENEKVGTDTTTDLEHS